MVRISEFPDYAVSDEGKIMRVRTGRILKLVLLNDYLKVGLARFDDGTLYACAGRI